MAGPSHHPHASTVPWDRQNIRDSVFDVLAPNDWRQEESQPDGLTCTLYSYQRRGLSWMLWREGRLQHADNAAPLVCSKIQQQPLPHLSDVFDGGFSTADLSAVSGGLLCDEMGLGKTVVSIALMLATKRSLQLAPPSQPELEQVQQGEQRFPGGTLVICPPALLEQWMAELKNRAGDALTVELYDGLNAAISRKQALLDAEYKNQQENNADAKKEGAAKKKARSSAMQMFSGDRFTQTMLREAELYMRRAAGDDGPVADSNEVAKEVAVRLATADVVLTSFDLLQREVHYDSNAFKRSLRHEKRYKVADSPLLQVDWQRLMLDEAQMVGPFSNSGTMVSRISAEHRWCVTGTPMSSGNEFADLRGLLTILNHPLFSANVPHELRSVWGHLVADPLKRAASGSISSDIVKESAHNAWDVLCGTLCPLGWRNSKAIVRNEIILPPRSLSVVNLRFHPGQQSFYNKIKEQLQKNQEDLQKARVEEAAEAAAKAAVSPVASPGGSQRKRRRPNASVVLEQDARNKLTELRLAAIHPQLTNYWKTTMRGDAQASDALASMEEVLQRLADHEGVKLQDAERNLCAHLNTLAMVLLGGAVYSTQVQKKLREVADSNKDTTISAELWAVVPSPAKKAKMANPPLPEVVEEAISLLEKSFKVSEKGIAAIDVDLRDLEKQAEPTQVTTVSWLAWKKVQISVAANLAAAYVLGGRSTEQIQKFVDATDKRSKELRESADSDVQTAQLEVDMALRRSKELRENISKYHEDAINSDFPTAWSSLPEPEAWLNMLDTEYSTAQEKEAEEMLLRNNKAGVLGKLVHRRLEMLEKAVQVEIPRLEDWLDVEKIDRGIAELHRDLKAVGKLSIDDQRVTDLRWKLYQLTELLSGFRRDTLRNRYEDIMPISLNKVEELDLGASQQQQAVAATAAKRSGDGDGAAAAVSTAVNTTDNGQSNTAKEPSTGPAPVQIETATNNNNEAAAAGAATIGNQAAPSVGRSWTFTHDSRLCLGFIRQPGYRVTAMVNLIDYRHEVADKDMLAAAARSEPFIASPAFQGVLPCSDGVYGFKREGDKIGYWYYSLNYLISLPHSKKDAPKASLSIPAILQECGQAVASALKAHQHTLQQRMLPGDKAAFEDCSFEAVESHLKGVQAQLGLLRHLRQQHVAERTLTLKMVLKEEADSQVEDAARKMPVNLRQQPQLRNEIEKYRAEAAMLRSKRAFIENQLAEVVAPAPQGDAFAAAVDAQAAAVANNTHSNAIIGGGTSTFAALTVQPAGPSASNTSLLFGPTSEVTAPLVDATPSSPSGSWQCPVCYEKVTGDIMLWGNCGHSCCGDCTGNVFAVAKTLSAPCPTCRVHGTLRNCVRVQSKRASNNNNTASYDPGAASDVQLSEIKVRGGFSVKIEALVRRVLALEPSEKCLVFTQFPSAMGAVSKALMTNNVGVVSLSGGRAAVGKALTRFQNDESVRAFLLSHRAGAQGLTLTRANHVMLLEPALEPAIEQQAIARVHRVGQVRPVKVQRFIVENTIEDEILRIQEERHRAMMHDIDEDENGERMLGVEGGHDGVGVGGDDNEDVEAPTTLAAVVGAEAMEEADAARLLNAVLN